MLPHLFDTATDSLRLASDGSGPAERLFNPFAVFQGQGIAVVAGGAAVDGRVAGLPSDMWGDAGLAEIGHEGGRVEAFVRAQRQPPGRSGRMPVNHIQRGAAFGMAISLGQVTLDDVPRKVLHQRRRRENDPPDRFLTRLQR